MCVSQFQGIDGVFVIASLLSISSKIDSKYTEAHQSKALTFTLITFSYSELNCLIFGNNFIGQQVSSFCSFQNYSRSFRALRDIILPQNF